MVVSDLSNIAAALREEGYEARNLGQVGVTVWQNGRGVFLSADDVRRLNGDVLKEVGDLLRAPVKTL